MAPASVPYRVGLPFYFILIFVLAGMVKELCSIQSLNYIKTALICIMLVLSSSYYMHIAEGYKINKFIYEINDSILSRASQCIANGEDIKKITLYRMIEDKYGVAQPYNAEYIKKYILLYYEIPEGTELEYIYFGVPFDISLQD